MNFTEYFYDLLSPVLKSHKSISVVQARLIFLKSLGDYFKERISTNYLASVATELYYSLLQPSDYFLNPMSHELGRILSFVSELDYAEEQSKKNVKSQELFKSKLKELSDYLEKNKNFL